MVAIADELIAVGKFPPIDAMRVCLDLLAHKRIRIPKPTHYWNGNEQALTAAIISFVEAGAAMDLPQTKIVRILNRYLSQRASSSLRNDYLEGKEQILFFEEPL